MYKPSDSTILISDRVEIEDGERYRVKRYKCGCSYHTLLEEYDPKERSGGYSINCSFCFYGEGGIPDLI